MVMLSFWLEGKINEKIWRGFATSDRVDRVDWASRVEVVDGQRRQHGATLEKSPSPRFVSPSRGLPMHFSHSHSVFVLITRWFCPSVLRLPLYPFYGWTWRGGNHQEKVTHSPKAAYNFCTTHLLYPTVSHLMHSWIQHLSHLTRQLYFNCLSFFFHDVCTRTRVLPWMMCHHLTSRAWRFCSPMVSSLHTTVYQQRSFSL